MNCVGFANRATPFVAMNQTRVKTKGDAQTMGTRVGINGFGRVGRQSLKAMLELHPTAFIAGKGF